MGLYMNKILKLIAIVLVMSMLTLPVLGKMGAGMMGSDNGDRGIISDEMMRGKAKEMHENGSDLREKEGIMGMGFMHREGNNFGRYITFSVNNTTGEVMNYGVLGLTVFDSIKVTSFDLKDIKTMGALTRITDKNGSIVIQLHDNPAAVINIMATGKAQVVFDLAEGINATKEENIVKIESGNFTGYIASGNTTAANIAQGKVIMDTDKGLTIFRATPVNMPKEEMHRGFMGEIMRNRAGAEISIGDFDRSSIVNYSDMNIMIRSMEKDRIRMLINSSDHAGKFITMNIDNSSLMWNERQKLRLYLDNKPMKQVMNEQDLYNVSESSFWLTMIGGNRMEAMMYIANFSERQVDIVVEDEVIPTPTVTTGTGIATATPKTPGFEIAVGMLCTVAAYRFRKRK